MLQKLYHVLRERILLIAICVGVGLCLGAIYFLWAPYVYAATTTVQVNQAERNIAQIQDIQSQDLTSLEVEKSIERNLSNLIVMRRVVKQLHLTWPMLNQGGPVQDVKDVIHKLLDRVSALIHPIPAGVGDPIDDLALVLQGQVDVELQKSTRVIAVTATNRGPRRAQQIAEAVVSQYMTQRMEEQSGHSSSAEIALRREAAELEAKLKRSEEALQEYKEQHQAVSLDNSQNITVEKLKDLTDKVTQAKGERLKLEADYAQVERLGVGDPNRLLSLPSVSTAPDVLDQKKKVADQEAELANLSTRYGPLHPKLVQAKSQLAESRAGLDRTIIRVAAGLSTVYESAKQMEEKFEQALADQEEEALALNKIAIPYNVLQREMQSDRALYDTVITRLKETGTVKNVRDDEIRVVDPAIIPEKPASPNILLLGVFSLFGGASAGVAIALLLGFLKTSITTVDDGEAKLGLPALSAIPMARKGDRRFPAPITISRPNSRIAEAFRTLRTELAIIEERDPQRTLLFASATPGEGKTYCASNYAAILAQPGVRVLLIDADLRVPSIGKMFGVESTALGVSDYIATEMPLTDLCKKTQIENLYVLPAGQRLHHPSDLLAGPRVGQLFEEAERNFHRIVVDSAPVHSVSDTLLIAKHIAHVCLVVRTGKAPYKSVLRALYKLTGVKSRPVGFALNCLPNQGGYYYGYSGEEYGAQEDSSSGSGRGVAVGVP